MPSPYKSKIMRLVVDGVTVGTVELATLEVLHVGGVESKYGLDYDYQYKPRNRHAVGMKRCKFTIRKWYKADSSNTDLFYTLFDNDTEFTLIEYLTNVSGTFIGLEVTECEIYTYTPTTGSSNDIIQEEIVGEGLAWYAYSSCPPCGELFTNGGFETGDLSGWFGDFSVLSVHPKAGTYHTRGTVTGQELSQNFVLTIPVSCFKDTSIFGLYIAGDAVLDPEFPYSVLQSDKAKIYAVFTDSSEVEIFDYQSSDPTMAYVYADFISGGASSLFDPAYANKTVKGIRIVVTEIEVTAIDIDECVLEVCSDCPTGEIMLNGSFEDESDGGDGNWYPTGWTCTNACGDDSGVVPPDGSWWIKSIAPNPTPYVFSVEQTLNSNILGSCISSATVWTYGSNNIGTHGHGTEFGVVIYYSDLTTDSMGWETSVPENQVWVERDFISCIDTTKTIVSIKITVDGTDAEAEGLIDWVQLISG